MNRLEELGTIITTDVLILGGGMAGLCAGIKAREEEADVLVVDKGGIGWAGQVPLGGGGLAYIYPNKVDEFCQWVGEYTHYFNNAEWTVTLAKGLTKVHQELDLLGVPFYKPKGEFFILPLTKDSDATKLDTPRTIIKLKNAAVSRGVKTLDKIFVVDLIQNENQVVGAIGLGLLDGKIYILKAKAVIITTGTCRFQAEKEYNWTLGEGMAMAYRAGAQLMGAEFSSIYFHTIKVLDGKQLMISPSFLYFNLVNARGEKIMEKYFPETVLGRKPGEEKADNLLLLDAMFREIETGFGPLYLDIAKLNLTPEEKKKVLSLPTPPGFKELYSYSSFRLLKDKLGIDIEKKKVEVQPLFGGGSGTIRIDLKCRTTKKGLWAAGDAASLGSGWSGSRLHMVGGTGIGFAAVSGFIAGKSAGEYASHKHLMEVDLATAKSVIEMILAPLTCDGSIKVAEVTHQIHQAVVPMKYNFKREAGRMQEALKLIEIAQMKLSKAGVRNFHELGLYYQAKSMALAAELTYKAAMLRRESRGQHIREDFPMRDDTNWRKWIIIEQREGGPYLFTESVA
jgi:succinate dehydrogenase / fumarate reductase, flavoprotein subunit